MILVTGGAGQVAQALADAAGRHTLRVVGRPDFDFDRPETLRAVLDEAAPSLVVNAAAYTAVDKAETDQDAAWRANRDGPAILAAWCAGRGARLIHISTDYVFDGLKGAPYTEDDETSPTGVYGASKRAGEEAVLASGAKALILRTSWVYAPRGKNFVLTMLNAARKTDRLRVVADQRGCPTAAADLADAILALADRWDGSTGGIFHAAGNGETTWHGLAEAVFARAEPHGLRRPTLEAIATEDWPTPARRPPDSRLDCARLAQTFGVALPRWEDSVARTVDTALA
ncbi:MAG TPA: dTDP-4-dehydrorhamnose reductase [Acetobacteraceae bacterium]|nr:dTDP-4-dehydrorhamnose reductase [Acetobacteraceae bacterium]